MKQEYLMLAHTFKPGKHNIGGWFLSEKLDGTRAFWDGGISRGIPASDISYANTVKDHRLKETVIATGLWSRSGKVIHAPDDWLDQLPNCFLDGELYLGRGRFQELRRIIADHVPSSGWDGVTLQVFDSPNIPTFSQPREVKIRNDYSFMVKESWNWFRDKSKARNLKTVEPTWTYETVYNWLQSQLADNLVANLIKQCRLPLSHPMAIARLKVYMDKFIQCGAEGAMLRRPASRWETVRSHQLLKHKPWFDAEAKITGFTSGRVTACGSRLRGKIGALIVEFQDKRLELSGLTDEERKFDSTEDHNYAWDHPGTDMAEYVGAKHFKVGQNITFKYRELSDDGIPKEARYWRSK